MMRVSHTHDVIGYLYLSRGNAFSVSPLMLLFFWDQWLSFWPSPTKISCGDCWVGVCPDPQAWLMQSLWNPFWRMSLANHLWLRGLAGLCMWESWGKWGIGMISTKLEPGIFIGIGFEVAFKCLYWDFPLIFLFLAAHLKFKNPEEVSPSHRKVDYYSMLLQITSFFSFVEKAGFNQTYEISRASFEKWKHDSLQPC